MNKIKILRDFSECKKFFKGHKSLLYLVIVIGIVEITISSITPFIYGLIIDAITLKNINKFKYWLLLYVIFIIFMIIIDAVDQITQTLLKNRLINELKDKLFRHIIRLEAKEYEKITSGEFVSHLESDVESVVTYYIQMISNLIMIIINFIIPVFFIVKISFTLSIISMFFLPSTTIVYLIFKRKLRDVTKKGQKLSDSYFTFYSEIFNNIYGIKSFQLEEKISKKYNEILEKIFYNKKNKLTVNLSISFLGQVLSNLFNIIIIFVSAISIMNNLFTIGNLVSFNMYITKLYQSIQGIQTLNVGHQMVTVSIQRLNILFSKSSEKTESKIKNNDKNIDGIKLDIRDLTFKYSSEDVFALKNINITFTNGLYSIVGKNGCGKTTLIKLLLKFYSPQNGSIFINQKSYSDLEINDIRMFYTYLQKETFIFNDTIKGNFLIINDKLDEEKISEICKKVQLHEYITNLPDGYDTVIGENGILFSSGMKQKLNFGRALGNERKIILLDEITSDLDGVSEKVIIELIKLLAKEQIVISISHKINTVIASKQIILMNCGEIVDNGTHQELLERNKIYYDLFNND